MGFSIIIPLYNEEHNISDLINEILASLNNLYKEFEILLVNDCSKDNTLKVINQISSSNKFIKIIDNNTNLGQSFSIIKGVKKAKYDIICTLDGDGQNNPIDIPRLMDTYLSSEKIYLVGGIRKNRKDNFIKKITSKFANKIRAKILKDNCIDTGCSLKVFDKNTFLKFPEFKGLHRFLPAFFMHYRKQSVYIDVDHRPRLKGKSNYGTLDRLIYGIIDLLRVLIILKNIKND